MAELKTQRTKESAVKFLGGIEPERKKDGLLLLKLFQKITGQKPVMWGESIVGFGMYRYKSERSSQEGDWPLVSFSPRKQAFTLYLNGAKNEKELLAKLGKHKLSGGCLHVKKLSDVNKAVLSKLIKNSFSYMKKINK